jgi:hypothetical protein
VLEGRQALRRSESGLSAGSQRRQRKIPKGRIWGEITMGKKSAIIYNFSVRDELAGVGPS